MKIQALFVSIAGDGSDDHSNPQDSKDRIFEELSKGSINMNMIFDLAKENRQFNDGAEHIIDKLQELGMESLTDLVRCFKDEYKALNANSDFGHLSESLKTHLNGLLISIGDVKDEDSYNSANIQIRARLANLDIEAIAKLLEKK